MYRLASAITALSLGALGSAAPPTDRQGDPLPDGAVARLGTIRFRGPSTREVTFSADGKKLYSAGDKVVFVWDAETGKRLPVIPCEPKGTSYTHFSSCVAGGRVIRIGVNYSDAVKKPEAFVAALADGKPLLPFAPAASGHLPSHNSRLTSAAVSADGSRLAVSTKGDGGTVVYDLNTGKALVRLGPESAGDVLAVEGATAYTVHTKPAVVRRWDTATAKRTGEIALPGESNLLHVSPDGKRLVGRTYHKLPATDTEPGAPVWENRLAIWDWATGKEVGQFTPGFGVSDFRFVGSDSVIVQGHEREVFLRDGKYPGTLSEVGRLARWHLTALKREWQTEFTVPKIHAGDLRFGWLAVSPDGRRCAVSNSGQMTALFDATTGKRIDGHDAHDGRVRWLRFSADGKTVYTIGEREQRTWDAATGELKAAVAPAEFRRGYPSLGGTTDIVLWKLRNKDNEAEVVGWDVTKGEVAWRFTPGLESVDAAYTHDGKAVVLTGRMGRASGIAVAVYDGPSGRMEWEWELADRRDGGRVKPLAVSANGKRLFAESSRSGRKNRVASYDTRNGDQPFEAELPIDTFGTGGDLPYRPLVVSADGKWMATLNRDTPHKGNVYLSDAATGEWKHTLWCDTPELSSVAFSPDGKRLVAFGDLAHGVADSRAWLFDLTKADSQKPRVLDGVSGATAAAFSPDGTRLAVGYQDGSALVWDVTK